MRDEPGQLLRLLVVLPSWVGDAVMATPALRLLRRMLPGVWIGGLARPGIEQVIDGLGLFDEVHVERASGVMGPKFVAAKIRPRRYDAALLLTNSFSTALTTRIAGIPRRLGYDRDARGLLLTDAWAPPPGAVGKGPPVSAVTVYWDLACRLLERQGKLERRGEGEFRLELPADARLELGVTATDRAAATAVLERAGLGSAEAFAVLNPGASKLEKRWPAERFAQVAMHLVQRRLAVLVSGSPGEAEVCDLVADLAGGMEGPVPWARVVSLPALGHTLGSLKGLLADGRCRAMVSNDTGPRHMAVALGVPTLGLFGPTDPRWARVPSGPGLQAEVVADPGLPAEVVADEVPERCRIDRIEVGRVVEAVERLLDGGAQGRPGGQTADRVRAE